MSSQNAFIFFPEGCLNKEGRLLGVNVSEFLVVVLDVISGDNYKQLNQSQDMPNITFMNKKLIQSDLKFLGVISTESNKLKYDNEEIDKNSFDIWITLEISSKKNKQIFRDLELCGYRYNVNCQLAFYNECGNELCHNEKLCYSLINNNHRAPINNNKSLKENLDSYDNYAKEIEFSENAYCFGADKYWIWEQIVSKELKWDMKMENFTKAFMIINQREVILLNYNIIGDNLKLIEDYSGFVNKDEIDSNFYQDSEDSIDLMAKNEDETQMNKYIKEATEVWSPSNLNSTSPFPDKKFFEQQVKENLKAEENKPSVQQPSTKDFSYAEDKIFDQVDQTKLEALKCPERNSLSDLSYYLLMLIFLINTIISFVNIFLYSLPLVFSKLPFLRNNRMFKMTYMSLSHKFKIYKTSVRYLYLRANR